MMVAPLRFVSAADILPGDVLVVRDQNSQGGRLIRAGAAIQDQPDTWDHVVIAHHIDAAGTYWGVEGRPGGVGWADLAPRIADQWTISNAAQPKTGVQRDQICVAAAGMLGVPYDWSAIAVATIAAIAPLWHRKDEWGPGVPGHVVCSSLADYVYEKVGLGTPAADRYATPADWASWILRQEWT